MSNTDDLSPLLKKPFSEAVNKLEDLLAQNGRVFLIGAGCSKCAGLPLIVELTEKVLSSDDLGEKTKEILMAIRDLFEDASPAAHIEDFLSELIDLLAIVNRRATRRVTNQNIFLGGKEYDKDSLANATKEIKRAIVGIINKSASIEIHQRFT